MYSYSREYLSAFNPQLQIKRTVYACRHCGFLSVAGFLYDMHFAVDLHAFSVYAFDYGAYATRFSRI